MYKCNEGQQPCTNFEPRRDEGPFYVHECPKCWGSRYACETCMRDHHEGGWESCKPEAYKSTVEVES